MKRKGNSCGVTNLSKIRKRYGSNSKKYKNVLRRCGRWGEIQNSARLQGNAPRKQDLELLSLEAVWERLWKRKRGNKMKENLNKIGKCKVTYVKRKGKGYLARIPSITKQFLGVGLTKREAYNEAKSSLKFIKHKKC